jgi:hypothetical protein
MLRLTRNFWPAMLALSALAALPAAAQAQGRVVWSGNVDDKVIVSVHGRDVRTDTISGKPATNINSDVFGRLPHQPVFVSVRGRGDIRVVQQPRFENDFTVRVRINDPQPGSHHYRFALVW